MEKETQPVQSTPSSAQGTTMPTKSSFLSNKILLSVFALIVLGVGFYLFHATQESNKKQLVMTPPVVTVAPTSSQPTPVISPVTKANVDSSLSTTDTTMQKAINQAATDLNDVNNVNASQDSTTGL